MNKRVKLKTSSSVSYKSYVPELQDALEEHLRANLQRAILIWERSLKLTLTGRRSGRIYNVPGTAIPHQASAPGEAPAVLTGVLRNSYQSEVSEKAMVAYLGSELDYALWLERGTTKMEPRPAIEPSFKAVEDQIKKALARPVKKSPSGGGNA